MAWMQVERFAVGSEEMASREGGAGNSGAGLGWGWWGSSCNGSRCIGSDASTLMR